MIDVCVIGGGAAGLMAAGAAAQRGLETVILERNEKVGRKVMITGKGRCNVTNNCALLNDLIMNIPVNGRFLFSAFSKFMPADTMEFFENYGVPLKVERGDRVFPESDKSSDIVDALRKFALTSGAKVITGRAKELVVEDNTVKGVKTYDDVFIEAKSVIVATGGKSYPLTGSTGDGYILAEKTGHTIIDPKPSLVPLEVHEGWCSSVMGLSLRNIAIRVEDNENYKCVYKDFGEMLFTHFGVSGPVILSASSHMKNVTKGKYTLYIDLKPALDEDKLDKRIQRDFLENSNKNFINALDGLLPKKLVPVIVRLSGIKPSQKVNQITRAQREELVYLLKNLKLTINGFRPIDEAIVTSGGVSVKDINPKNMMSKKVDNLFFAGEVIDVDAYTGGFNLQIAFSTGMLAGKSVLAE
ncbi:MAG: NAD(P)/FAD-dependent oxidoreductase [Ruminococcaceae bacterium]|nr:NAD(P)/FAD-dependent oxidoreductase [Oscillospiraceae bacterium]